MSNSRTPPLILASSSRYRAALLERLSLPFEQVSPDVDETPRPGESPNALVARLAVAKGNAVALAHPEALIISSDQVAALGDDILGKPHTVERAIEQLQRLSGRSVEFLTSLRLLDAGRSEARETVVTTTVGFRELSTAMIEDYVARERPLDCAGAFKSEGLGTALFTHLSGDDPTALIGLPLIALCDFLGTLGRPVLRTG